MTIVTLVSGCGNAHPDAEKASMVVRLTAAAGALGVGRVLVSTDTFGVSAAVLRESRRRAEAGDPRVEAGCRESSTPHGMPDRRRVAQPVVVPLRSLTVKPSSACLSATSMSSWWMSHSPSPGCAEPLGVGTRPARGSAGPRPWS